jgi:subtilisin family serine protease
MRVLIQLRATPRNVAAAMAGQVPEGVDRTMSALAGVVIDPAFPAVAIPRPEPAGASVRLAYDAPITYSLAPEDATYIVRGQIPDDDPAAVHAVVASHPDVVGVFSDPVIEPCAVCPGSAAVGSAADVGKELGTSALARAKLDGRKVRLAVVDTGINLAHLRSKGQSPTLSARNSWSPSGVTTKPGEHPVDHGTMCAFDASIAAPKATLLDYALLLSQAEGETAMSGLLSDAVLGYSRLLGLKTGSQAARRAPLVVSNSWGMFSPEWDFPVGHPGNYSDNPAHPFNVIVGSLEAAGADILFAAGNCGRDCPDSRCGFPRTANGRPVCGANSHPAVLSVAGIDVKRRRAGYSSQGPGRLTAQKPDISGYTHFKGSGVYPEDGGTSAACPVVAGVVAAVRSGWSVAKVSPVQLRTLIYKTATDLGGTGYDYDHGWGAVNPSALVSALRKVK